MLCVSVSINSVRAGYYWKFELSKTKANLGERVTATASTNDPEITKIRIEFYDPKGTLRDWTDFYGSPVTWCSSDSPPLDKVGMWTVKAIFYRTGSPIYIEKTVIVVGLNIIPEFPFGTVAPVLASMAALIVTKIRRRRRS